MNKLLTKIVGIALGATMAIGVGVAIASNNKETAPVYAAVGTDTRTVSMTSNSCTDGNGTTWALNSTSDYGTGTASGTTYIRFGSGSYIQNQTAISVDKSYQVQFEVTTRKYGGPSDDQIVLTVDVVNSTGTSLTTGATTVSPGNTTLTKKTSSALSFETASGNADVFFRIKSSATATSSKCAGVSVITVKYKAPAETKHTVSFNANGGSGSMASSQENEGSYALPDCTFGAPDGYAFAGWKVNNSGSILAAGTEITLNDDVVLWAQWAEVVTVTYKANGGTGSDVEVEVGKGASYKVAENTFAAPSGKAFKEWNTSSDGTGSTYVPGTSYTFNSDTDLYAIWLNAYVVNFGTDATTSAINGTTDFDDVYTIPSGITLNYTSGNIYGATGKCIRIGKDGYGVFTVSIGSDYYVTTVTANAYYFGSDTTAKLAVTPSGGSATAKGLTSSWADVIFDISSSKVSSFTFGTSVNGKRAYVSSITVAYASHPASLTLTSVSGNSFTQGDSGNVTATISTEHCSPDHYGATSSDSSVLNSNNISIIGTSLSIAKSNVSAGSTTITVTAYDSGDNELASDSFVIVCAAAVRNLLSIAKTTNSSDTLFERGDKFTITDLVITGTFDAAPLTEDVTTGCTFKLWNGSSETALTPGTTTLNTVGGFTVRISHVDSAAAETLSYTIEVVELTKATIDYTSLDDFAASYKDYDGGVATTYGNSLSSEIDLKAIQFYKGTQSSASVLQTNTNKTDPALYNTSAVPGTIHRITVTSVTNDNATPTIYFATNAPATAGNVSRVSGGKVSLTSKVGSISVPLSSGYSYFFLDCNTCGGATYMSKIEVEYVVTDLGAAKNYEDHFLMMQDIPTSNENDTNACRSSGEGAKSYYSNAKTAFGKLTADIKDKLSSNALSRLHAWAEANSESFDIDNKAFGARNTSFVETMKANSSATIIVIVSLISLASIGGYFFLRKRKEVK